jgi:hypothetical protein
MLEAKNLKILWRLEIIYLATDTRIFLSEPSLNARVRVWIFGSSRIACSSIGLE